MHPEIAQRLNVAIPRAGASDSSEQKNRRNDRTARPIQSQQRRKRQNGEAIKSTDKSAAITGKLG
jgi:hypothetical protein